MQNQYDPEPQLPPKPYIPTFWERHKWWKDFLLLTIILISCFEMIILWVALAFAFFIHFQGFDFFTLFGWMTMAALCGVLAGLAGTGSRRR